MNTTTRLREQNKLRGWLDCAARGHAHKLVRGAVRDFWDCKACPVAIYRPKGKSW